MVVSSPHCAFFKAPRRKCTPLAIQKAFEWVGKVAMQELMTDQGVMAAISNYVNYADQEKFGALLTN